ncbi:MAG: hypothetical protein ACO1QS_20870 [Verrucomicrobiota bacterium]
MNGKPVLGAVGGFVAAIIGAAIWATVTVLTEYQIGWMAVGVGILVGLAIRVMGRGNHIIYPMMGGVFALLGCVLGNLLSGIGFLAKELDMSYFAAMGEFDWSESFALLKAMSSVMDILFYAIAIYEGVKFSIFVGAEDSE